jgi:hypothetical protein
MLFCYVSETTCYDTHNDGVAAERVEQVQLVCASATKPLAAAAAFFILCYIALEQTRCKPHYDSVAAEQVQRGACQRHKTACSTTSIFKKMLRTQSNM